MFGVRGPRYSVGRIFGGSVYGDDDGGYVWTHIVPPSGSLIREHVLSLVKHQGLESTFYPGL